MSDHEESGQQGLDPRLALALALVALAAGACAIVLVALLARDVLV